MSDNVIPLFGEILHDEPVKKFLYKVAENQPLDIAIVIGQTEDGSLFMGGNIGDFEKLVFLMFRAINHMNRIENCFPNLDEKILK